jgi:hypothetical protein
MRKAREEIPYKNLGRIRRNRNMITERRDSNLLSIETFQIQINQNILLRMNTKRKTP